MEHKPFIFKCPGCDSHHVLDKRWSWDGNEERPTFSPSYLMEGGPRNMRCHFFLTGGCLHFLPDSTHALAGRSVPLPCGQHPTPKGPA